ncbi:hypothetical protein GCM10011383_43890 [Hymenobacter cavernae]|uniref:HNH endonuclease n=2 Tax=Hymenobacter cavernae TaxID=2044852 RepID=A0ABQ1UUH2_9BACT|nr:hypothetical protein GCM10011383_43890 [Hymenobacter cavernae]
MLYIPPHSLKILKAKKAFHVAMADFVYERIDKIDTIKGIDCNRVRLLFDIVLNDNIDDILIGEPAKLIELNTKINPLIQRENDLKKAVEYVFSYDVFCDEKKIKYWAYDLASALKIDTCVYCNRNYTSTVVTQKGKKVTRPQFDHFFDKGKNPLLAISFYNLIPSCSICNSSIKGTATMNLSTHLHPYVDDGLADITFSYRYSHIAPSGIRIKVEAPNSLRASNTINVFAIEEIYNAHTSELQDLLRIRRFFSDRYLDILNNSLLKGVSVSKPDLYRVVFGTEYEASNFVKRPFSKFKSDILKELGVI